MQIAVCLITYQRPDGLKRLLSGLNQLTFKQCEPTNLEIIVVDNDLNGTACLLCEQISSEMKWTLKCYVEPRRGIPYARNKAIACAIDHADFIAFIDDDEVPEPFWLDQLLHVQRLNNGADVVCGPVLPYFDKPVPDWITKGKFFERPRYPTGHFLNGAATNNVLISSQVFRKMDKAFDERLALSGGSDWHFFRRVHCAGYKIVWADDALVYEWIPTSRANVRWLLQRSYRLGITESFCEIDIEPSLAVRVTCIFKGVRRIIKGALSLPLSFIRGRHEVIKTLRYIYHSVGMLAGVAGRQYQEYQKIHNV